MPGTGFDIHPTDACDQAGDLLDRLARILRVDRDRFEGRGGAVLGSARAHASLPSPDLEAALLRMEEDVRTRFRELLHELDR